MVVNDPQHFITFFNVLGVPSNKPYNTYYNCFPCISQMSCSLYLEVHSLLLIFHSSLSPIRVFNNCTTTASQGLCILFLIPTMGSSLPTGQWVIQLQNPFEKLLCRIISSINGCRSGSGKRTLRHWYFLECVYLSMFYISTFEGTMNIELGWGKTELQCSCNISFSQCYGKCLN